MVIRLRRIYNFLLFHANILQLSYTFWQLSITIFGTNILIQCPVPVPVCCMFYVSQGTHIKRNPNRIKTDRELFWNIWDFPEEQSTRNGVWGGHEIGGRAPTPGRSLGSRGPPVRRLMPLFCRKKANIQIEIVLKFQPNRSYGSPGI